MKRKHGLSLFITSCIPGCGQMHQGYMKRGVSLLMAVCTLFALALILGMDALLFFVMPLWLYAFFDSYNLRGQTDEQAAANPDCYLFGLSDMDAEKLSSLIRRRSSIIGWVLVVLGSYILFDTFVGRLMHTLCEHLGSWWLYDMVMRDFPRMVMTIFIIALGVWFIRGPKQAPQQDIPVFTPPAESFSAQAETSAPTPPEDADTQSDAPVEEEEVTHGTCE